jgi:hypothetical protein
MGDYFSKLDVLEFDMGKFEDEDEEEEANGEEVKEREGSGTRESRKSNASST